MTWDCGCVSIISISKVHHCFPFHIASFRSRSHGVLMLKGNLISLCFQWPVGSRLLLEGWPRIRMSRIQAELALLVGALAVYWPSVARERVFSSGSIDKRDMGCNLPACLRFLHSSLCFLLFSLPKSVSSKFKLRKAFTICILGVLSCFSL